MLKNNEKGREKRWLVKSQETPEANAAINHIAQELKTHPIVAKLLYNRGYKTAEDASRFIFMESEMLCNPFDMKDMDKAVRRIQQALRNKEKITVYGDYDVDGVTAVCTLYLYLKSCGANVEYYIPNRAGEGYGVSVGAINSIKENGSNLIITVDTGVTAIDEIEYAKSVGVDFIITDHHECHEQLPEAAAVINPHRQDCPYPFKELAGVGVVFKLICAFHEYSRHISRISATLAIIRKYADLVAIGTIADVMPITDENRIIVKYGLEMIEKDARVGLAALIDASSGKSDFKKTERNLFRKRKKVKITSSFIGFTLAPRINAAGRVRSASLAVELFLADTYEKAYAIAEELCLANKERQNEENKIMLDAYKQIESLNIKNDPVIVLNADNWHHGVIGIVSSRITEKYCRPSILVSFDGNTPGVVSPDDVGKGSGRSIKGLNLVEALYNCSEHLVKYGGHELAAGLSVTREKLPIFIKSLNDYARNNLSEEDMVPVIECDCEISFSDISLMLAEELSRLEPYGVGNPVPMFAMKNVNVVELVGVSEGKHSRLTLGNGKNNIVAMYFSNSPASIGASVGDKVDLLFSIDINEWLDRKSVQLIVRDLKLSPITHQNNEDLVRFEEIKAGATFSVADAIYPEREDFVWTYKYIQNALHNGISVFSHRELCNKLSSDREGRNIGYVKLKFIIMVFKELNIIGIEDLENEKYRFTIHFSSNKKNLDKSSILRKLRSQIR